jgi:hypothetical protein
MKPSFREYPLLAPITVATDPRYNEYIEKLAALKAELSAECKGRARHIMMLTSSSGGAVCWQALVAAYEPDADECRVETNRVLDEAHRGHSRLSSVV